MLMQVWGDTMLTTALLVLAVLIIRKPFARHFGPRLAYTLWLVPALRLVLPPLPFADTAPAAIPVAAASTAETVYLVPADALAQTSAPSAAAAAWSFADALPWVFGLWALGFVAMLAGAAISHRRFRRAVLDDAVRLEPLGNIRLIMTDAVDGPVAFGLWRRFVAVPQDFFARYLAEERALAIDHELAHHRHGDLWANAAALLLLASQWFNPFAWRAIRAFRFDQEAACDARVLTMADGAPREQRTAHYATAIAKAAVGSRLSLAAPMAVHDNLRERLTMLMQQDISKKRGLVGRLLVGGATLAVLATTATLVPAGIASASTQESDIAAPPPPAPPTAPEAPQLSEAPASPEAPAAPESHGVMIFSSTQDGGDSVAKDGARREVHRVVVRESSDEESDGAPRNQRRFEVAMPGNLSRDDILATLKEQGVTGSKADAIADKLEAKRTQRFTTDFAPMPPIPPMPPMPAGNWASMDGKAMAVAHCGNGVAPIVDRKETDGKKRSRVVMLRCGDTAETKMARLSALKKARDSFARGEAARGLSADMRAKVAADLDKAIAEMEKSGE